VEFRVLGPLEVVEDGRRVPLDRRRLRALLAFLLLHANELVSSDRLIDEVWGPEPPKTAGASLQNYISRLRRAIGPELIVSQPPGYILRIDPERFDLARFERLTAEARGAEPREQAQKLRAALALWRGPALDDLAFEPFARDEVGRLEEARLAALETRIEADLALGSGADLVTELEGLVEAHPLRERFRGQLMRALYRAGRQADALAAYRDARTVLMDELGLEPSQQLRSLEQAILQHDPGLGAVEQAPAQRSADRRTVTVLFCDLVESTRLANELDPEVYRRVISRYFEVVRAQIERHGGTIEKFIGDAVMAVFGVPELHEDDALRAVRAAVGAQEALRSQAWDRPLAARIGISTGEVHVLSAPGEELHVSGAGASAASRLQQEASPGGVLLGDATYRLVRDAVRAEPVNGSWRVLEVVEGAAPYTRRLDAPLVGRKEELQRSIDAFESACDQGRCRIVTVLGEAGIGKTRLIREVLGRLDEQARILVGRCASYGEGATYLPIAEIVRQAAPTASVTGIASLLEGAADGEQIVRRIAELTGIAEGPAAPGEAFWAVRRFFETLASRSPLVVVIDDIHWAEPTLLDLVEYLGEWSEAPMLVLCAARRELLEERPSWGGPGSTGFAIELDPLPPEEISTLVAGLTDSETAEQVVEYAGGNPLFAEQLVALEREAPGEAFVDPPASIEALLASRLDRLQPAQLALIRRAAVMGRRFSRDEVLDLTAADEAGAIDHHLAALSQRVLIHPAEDVFRFHHVLVCEVAYRGIPKSERAYLHELAARNQERRDVADEVVGYHFEQAHRYLSELGETGEHSQRLAAAGGEHLGRAGIRAWKRADVPAAVSLLSRAVQLVPDAHSLSCELALALNARGDRARAQELLADAQAADDERIALRATLESTFLQSLEEPERAAELLDVATAAIPVLEEADDDRALGRAWFSVAYIRGGFYCQYAAMEEAAEHLVACYRRSGWSTSAAAELLGLALYFGPTPAEEAITRLEELSDATSGDRATEANAAVWLGWLESMRGNVELARNHVEHARGLFRDLGLTAGVVDACGRAQATVELSAGFPDVAEQALRAACAQLQELGQTSVVATRAAELSAALYELGRYDDAASWVRLARECAGAADLDAALTRQPVEAKTLARLGQLDDAERLARANLELAAQTDSPNRQADAYLALAEVLELANNEPAALEHLHSALALYERKGNIAAAARARAKSPGGAPRSKHSHHV
jgi:DNA-binding SARP family transcriptional activator/tetratricopeptide (TPR) repeat protein